MADVRLTATNPEDSSVVPVACNAKGELKLEEPIILEGPQGPQGDPGEPGQDGDPFTGNFQGDVVFDSDDSEGPLSLLTKGSLNNIGHAGGEGPQINFALRRQDGAAQYCARIKAVAEADLVSSWPTGLTFGLRRFGNDIEDLMHLTSGGNLGVKTLSPNAPLDVNGAARFGSNKAGFTAEGYLFCTTRRGDTVILDFTSNGTGQWVDYTPPARELSEDLSDQPEVGTTTDIDSSRLTED